MNPGKLLATPAIFGLQSTPRSASLICFATATYLPPAPTSGPVILPLSTGVPV